MLQGVDCSDYQGQVDWTLAKASGMVEFVFCKATEGLNNEQAMFVANHDACKANGIPFGAYHFFHFGADPVDQANHFLSVIDGYEGQLLPMVDVESGGQDGITDLPTLIATLGKFTETVEKTLGGKKCIIYSDYGDWNGFMQGTDAFARHPFWVAEYNSDTYATLPGGFTEWVLWQWTSGGTVQGIPGFVDRNRLNGNDLGIIER
jgi:lysozyme